MFPDFSQHKVRVSRAEINFRRGGEGPPLLLLHGYPQTHAMWHKIAPDLARRFTVIAADLRGYGDSAKPPAGPDHREYSKRAMAADMVEVMAALGWAQYAVVGHDRGARVAYRMALDHRDAVTKLVTLDIVPTHVMWAQMDKVLAMATYHWLFLAQPDGLPEAMIGANPRYYLHELLRRWSGDFGAFTPEAMAEYERCFADPATIHASCEDYRAGATIDDAHDMADAGRNRIACPMLALWGERGLAKRRADVLAVWQDWASDVRGHPIDSGHFLPEEAPGPTLAAIEAFL
ncbi:MAG: alpha/beta hydrolase [Proteobacteria bacterium]|nr:alpha/beta hydrolase [Pseudomonadota bacterium]